MLYGQPATHGYSGMWHDDDDDYDTLMMWHYLRKQNVAKKVSILVYTFTCLHAGWLDWLFLRYIKMENMTLQLPLMGEQKSHFPMFLLISNLYSWHNHNHWVACLRCPISHVFPFFFQTSTLLKAWSINMSFSTKKRHVTKKSLSMENMI